MNSLREVVMVLLLVSGEPLASNHMLYGAVDTRYFSTEGGTIRAGPSLHGGLKTNRHYRGESVAKRSRWAKRN
jgi:hypothetical protein